MRLYLYLVLTTTFLWAPPGAMAQLQLQSDRIGIQTLLPESQLDVRSAHPSDPAYIQLATSDKGNRILWYSGTDQDPNPYMVWTNGRPFRLGVVQSGFKEYMRFSQTGYVGIGTTQPLRPLHVQEGIRLEGTFDILSSPGDSTISIGLLSGTNTQAQVGNNIWIGALAGQATSNSNRNVGIGYKTLQENSFGSRNTAIGYMAMAEASLSYNNTALGYQALLSSNDGILNTAIGYLSLFGNQGGDRNTGVGTQSLLANTSGSGNTAVGYAALEANSTGGLNSAVGSHSLANNSSGNNNTAIGNLSLADNASGHSNTAIGNMALRRNTAGFLNTAVGAFAFVDSTNFNNSSGFGSYAQPTGSNRIRLGDDRIVSIHGNVGMSTTSDGRYKKSIREDVPGISFIESLRPVTYKMDLDAIDRYRSQQTGLDPQRDYPGRNAISDIRFSGFIAQEVEAAAADIGYPFSGIDQPENAEDLYALRYSSFVVPLVKATQEQQYDIRNLQNQINQQQNLIHDLQSRQEELITQLEEMETFLTKVINGEIHHEPYASLQLQPHLSQNQPNPFRRQTQINYFIPPGFNEAELLITNAEGKEVRRIELTQSGRSYVDLRTRTFPSGNYQYSLLVDGQLIDTKKMIVQ